MKIPYAKFITIVPLVVALGVSFAHAQQVPATSGDLKWVNAPASLPRGAKLAMLQGDLGKPGTLTFRLKLPAGYQLRPHWSPGISAIFVISGTFNVGYGEKFEEVRTLPLSSGYVSGPGKSPYFGWTKEETIIEIQGVGPWAVNYVNPADDPVNKISMSNYEVP